jgi:hypothetical protein
MLQEACRRARRGIGREEPMFEIGRNTVRGGKTVYGAAHPGARHLPLSIIRTKA